MGIPYAVKDILCARGAPTTGSCSALARNWVDKDADVVARLREAGAVLVGKTNLHELGWGPEMGSVRNPANPALIAGGSSGGSAAAVASGAVPFAIGTDAGGSIRIPAAFCGIVGFKPTHERVSRGGHLPSVWTLGEVGPLAASVADTSLVLACISDPPGKKKPAEGVRRGRKRPRIGVVPASMDSATREIAAALEDALEDVVLAGWDVEERSFDEAGSLAAWSVTYASELAAALVPWLGERLTLVSDELRTMVAIGERVPAFAYLTAQRYRSRLFADVEAALTGLDALVLVTVTSPPTTTEPEWGDESYLGVNRWLVPFNLTGHPAITLPLATPGSGAAVQLVGHVDGDELLLEVAQRLEETLSAAQTTHSRGGHGG